jgi:hypothetical protein
MNIKITYLEEQIEKAMKSIHLNEESIKDLSISLENVEHEVLIHTEPNEKK